MYINVITDVVERKMYNPRPLVEAIMIVEQCNRLGTKYIYISLYYYGNMV